MDSKFLEQQIATMRQSLFNEEILSYQFTTLEEMKDVDDPNFVQTVANSYLSESPNYIHTIEQTLEAIPLDLAKLDRSLHKFKGSSASIGANKVHIEIIKMLDCFEGGDMEGCKAGLPSLKQEFDTLKNKLKAYLELLQQDRPGTSSSGAK